VVSEFEKDDALVGLTGFIDAWGGNFLQRLAYKWSNILFITLSFALGKPGFQGQSFAFRKSAFMKIGGFKTYVHTCEDMDLGYRMSKVGRVKLLFKILGVSSIRRINNEPLLKAVSRGFLSYLRLLWGLPITQKEKEPFPAIR
jgi:cellulose synthase/poly-beta-1,6-N-acetylglucosamine synthase-like glycosyltransferase